MTYTEAEKRQIIHAKLHPSSVQVWLFSVIDRLALASVFRENLRWLQRSPDKLIRIKRSS